MYSSERGTQQNDSVGIGYRTPSRIMHWLSGQLRLAQRARQVCCGEVSHMFSWAEAAASAASKATILSIVKRG